MALGGGLHTQRRRRAVACQLGLSLLVQTSPQHLERASNSYEIPTLPHVSRYHSCMIATGVDRYLSQDNSSVIDQLCFLLECIESS